MTSKKAAGIHLDMEEHLLVLKRAERLLAVTSTSEVIDADARIVLDAIYLLLSPAVKKLTDQWRELGDAIQGTREPQATT